MRGNFEAPDVEALDGRLRDAREAITADYERRVRENMEALANCFARALQLDLVGPDDFGPSVSPAR